MCLSISELVSAVSAFGALLTAYFAYKTIRDSKAKERLEVLRGEAERCLESAYDTLMFGAEHGEKPLPSRINWLMSARHIVRFWSLKEECKGSVHEEALNGAEALWRDRFAEAVGKIPKSAAMPDDSNQLVIDHKYFEGTRGPSSSIAVESAIIVHAFASWPKGEKDAIHNVDCDALIQDRPTMIDAFPGLRFYIQKKGMKNFVSDYTV